MKRWMAFITVFAIITLLFNPAITSFAETSVGDLPLKDRFPTGLNDTFFSEEQVYYYERYLKDTEITPAASQTVTVGTEAATVTGNKVLETVLDRIAIKSDVDSGNISWQVNVPYDGKYVISLDYVFNNGTELDAQRSLIIDGKSPFYEAEDIVFSHIWKDNDDKITNSVGDEIKPTYSEISVWQNLKLCDSQGLYSYPFEISFTAGVHTITLEYVTGELYFGDLELSPLEKAISYEDYLSKASKDSAKGFSEVFQAEEVMLEKNSTTLTMESDGNPSTIPNGITSKKLNTVGGWRWRNGNQKITWEITVPKDGFYKIGVRYLQSWNDGLSSFRKIELDGEVPFEEMLSYGFKYADDWAFETLSDENNEPYLFYLTKGSHRLSMSVTVADYTEVINSLNDDANELSNIIKDITMLTGSEPDIYYDYDFYKKIPDLKQRLQDLYNSLGAKYTFFKASLEKVPAMANNFKSIMKQLEVMIDDQFKIARGLSELENAQSSLGTYYQNLKYGPVIFDYFSIASEDEVLFHPKESGFFKKLWATVLNFVSSFTKDYDNISGVVSEDVEIKENITIWISRGTEWAEIIKLLIDREFTTENGIGVTMNILPAAQLSAGGVNALMLAIAADRAPDLAMGVDSASPAEFAFRDAVCDLSKFDDFPEIKARFLEAALNPYSWNGGIFAIPETMNFNVMYYRTDIFQEIGLSLPDTWTELYEYTLPTLYQNGYEFFYPTGGFAPFLYQNGADYYNEECSESALDTPEAYAAFKEYCEIFTNYAVPISANFFNRFRTGTMPLGVGDYSTYITLYSAAPELRGNWSIYPIPGTETESGEIDRSHSGVLGECLIIMQQSKKQDAAWEFLKWWTNEETQSSFANNLEATIGVEARWNTANINAFKKLPFKVDELEVITSQWKWAKEAPAVLGSYYTTRYIGNAWNSTVVDNKNYKDSVDEAVEAINKEMTARREEYGLDADWN